MKNKNFRIPCNVCACWRKQPSSNQRERYSFFSTHHSMPSRALALGYSIEQNKRKIISQLFLYTHFYTEVASSHRVPSPWPLFGVLVLGRAGAFIVSRWSKFPKIYTKAKVNLFVARRYAKCRYYFSNQTLHYCCACCLSYWALPHQLKNKKKLNKWTQVSERGSCNFH